MSPTFNRKKTITTQEQILVGKTVNYGNIGIPSVETGWIGNGHKTSCDFPPFNTEVLISKITTSDTKKTTSRTE